MQVTRIAIVLVGLIGFAAPCFAQGSWDIGPQFAENHPRRTEVLTGDNTIGQELQNNAANLGSNYNNLVSQQQAIGQLEQQYAQQNGGFITTAQQAQLDQMEANLQSQINATLAANGTGGNGGGGTGNPGLNISPVTDPLYPFDVAALQNAQRNSGNTSALTGSSATTLTIPGLGNVAHNPFPGLGKTGTGILGNGGSQALGATSVNVLSQFGNQGLPATSLDSFVAEAGGAAESIYGDEGVFDIPPFFGMDESHTIETGIPTPYGVPGPYGLSTGHPSGAASAWCTYE